MYLTWNAYLRFMDVNYNLSFSCPNCAITPETVIFDRVTLCTLKDLPKYTPLTENHVTMHIPIQHRVLTSSPRVRTSLKQ